MNITEAHETVKLLRHLDRSQPDADDAYAAALYLAARASTALQMGVGVDEEALADSMVEVER